MNEMQASGQLAQIDREEKRNYVRAIACVVALVLGCAGLAFVLPEPFNVTKAFLVFLPLAIFVLKRPPKASTLLRSLSTRALIELQPQATLEQWRRIVGELKDRAKGRDRMAKAFLYGRAWEGEVDGAGSLALRDPRESNQFRLPEPERIRVIEESGRFRTIVSLAERLARRYLNWSYVGILACPVCLDFAQLLKESVPWLSEGLRFLGTVGPSLVGVAWFRFGNGLPREQFEHLSLTQVLHVFVQSRGHLANRASAWISRRASWNREARAAAERLGILEPKPVVEGGRVEHA